MYELNVGPVERFSVAACALLAFGSVFGCTNETKTRSDAAPTSDTSNSTAVDSSAPDTGGAAACRRDARSSLPSPTAGTLYARRTDPGAIATDGRLNEFGDRWLELQDPRGESDNRLSISALWTSKSLHLGFKVRDPDLETPASAPEWNRDSLEFAWEPDRSQPQKRSDRVKKWLVTADGASRFGRSRDGSWEQPSTPPGTRHRVRSTDGAYRVELTVPWEASAIEPDRRRELTICIRNNDRDDGSVERLGCLAEADSFDNPSTWGTLKMVDPTPACPGDSGVQSDTGSNADSTGGSCDPGDDVEFADFDRSGTVQTVGSSTELEKAVGNASPGDVIKLQSGTYAGDIAISGASGTLNRPITIAGTGSDRSNYPVIDGGDQMGDSDRCMLIENLSWIRLEKLRFENCWDEGVRLSNTRYVTLHDLVFTSATIPARVTDGSHHTLIEDSLWKPANQTFWEDVRWRTVKKDDGSKWHTLMASSVLDGETRGANVIRDNELSYTFNAYRNRFSAKTLNTEIYDNHFHHIRDNAIEPEAHLFNFHVYHNTFNQIDPGIISVDSDSGGLMYLYGNVGRYDPNDPSRRFKRTGIAGHVFKLVTVQNTYLDRPMYVFHNSFYNYAKAFKPNRYQKNIKHFNNAYKTTQGMWLGGWSDGGWLQGKGNEFDYDAAASSWNELAANGHEQNGLENTKPNFRDPMNGDFRLQANSALIDAGKSINGFPQEPEGAGPDIGAYEGDERVPGPPFYIRKPSDGLTYKEHPRVTRHDVSGSTLTVYFSWPLDPSTVDPNRIALFEDGGRVCISNVRVGPEGRKVTIDTSKKLDAAKLDLCFEPLPTGDNGQKATYWGATLRCRGP